MTSAEIHIMHHGEADDPKDILYGRLPDYGLIPLGRETVQGGVDFLRDQGTDITIVISSPLLHAQLIAAPTASAYDLPIIPDPCPIEAGDNLEDSPVNADCSLLLCPSAWKNCLRPLEPSWDEPYVDTAKRMRATVSGVLKAAEGHEALIVSYQSPTTTLTCFARRRSLAHAP